MQALNWINSSVILEEEEDEKQDGSPFSIVKSGDLDVPELPWIYPKLLIETDIPEVKNSPHFVRIESS